MSITSGFITTFTVVVVVVFGTVIPHSEATRAFFIFGDSLVEQGNNNYLATTARADSPPYGIDYPTHQATGRFCNGINIPDMISRFFTLLLFPRLVPNINTIMFIFQVNNLEKSPHCHT